MIAAAVRDFQIGVGGGRRQYARRVRFAVPPSHRADLPVFPIAFFDQRGQFFIIGDPQKEIRLGKRPFQFGREPLGQAAGDDQFFQLSLRPHAVGSQNLFDGLAPRTL